MLEDRLQAPQQFCRRKGAAYMLTTADMKLMDTRLKPNIMDACQIMGRSRARLGSDMRIMPAMQQRIMGDLDVRLLMHVHGFEKQVKPENSTTIWKRSPGNSRNICRMRVAI